MKRLLSVFLTLLTLLSLSLVFIPAFLIRPFAAQSSTGLLLSYRLRSLKPHSYFVVAGGCVFTDSLPVDKEFFSKDQDYSWHWQAPCF